MSEQHESEPETIVQRLLENDPFSIWMGISILKVREGYCELSCRIRPEMLNGFGVTHGGIVFSLADTALAFSAATYGTVALAIDNSISFTRPSGTDDVLTAVSEARNITRKTGLFDVQIKNEKDELIALFKGTVYRTGKELES